jgi:uncharacterized protein
VPEAKRPDPKRRSPASRPARAGDAQRGRPKGASPTRPAPRAAEAKTEQGDDEATTDAIKQSIAESAELQSEQRFGSAARRAAILAVLVCVLTLTIAGPVRTYFAQRTEMHQLAATEAKLRAQIAELEQQKVKLGDPAYIAAQARERLGFVMPGEVPYQVQLPPGAVLPTELGPEGSAVPSDLPWYTALWRTIADEPHGLSPATPPPGPPADPTIVPPDAPPPGG